MLLIDPQAGRIMRVAQTIVAVAVLLGLTAQNPAQAQELHHVIQNWLRCYIIDGRVAFDGTRLANIGPFAQGMRGSGQEVLKVRNENGQSVLSYERATKDGQFAAEMAASGERLVLRRTPRGGAAILPAEFKQVANEKITLTVGSGAGQQVFRARSIWRLLITQPKECQQHLLPLLEMLRPDWNLVDTAARVEQKLLQDATGDGVSNRARWAALVTQLGDESFAKREAADPMVWCALLARSELSTRQTAARELVRLLGEPITVDPAAAPDTQKDRRELLRTRLGEKD